MQEKPLRRIFIAVNLPGEVKKGIYEKACRVVEAAAKDSAKVVEKENLHITLKFVGYVDENELQEIIKVVEGISFGAFEFTIEGAGSFGGRVLWVGVGAGAAKLVELAEAVQAVVEKGDNRFSPHITIARNKSMPLGKMRGIAEKINSAKINMKVKAGSFEVMESKLGRNGPEYSVVYSRKLNL